MKILSFFIALLVLSAGFGNNNGGIVTEGKVCNLPLAVQAKECKNNECESACKAKYGSDAGGTCNIGVFQICICHYRCN
ncbi:hypothetical protein G2W53_020683 [Senna tora]|uniref:Uncharacterized protein n=1 Tax=Senna tora TaxID=362788 RepID=A0A834TRK7_9FABA|nr:hypothetical protein G2W53_020683 [Senna tora]